MNLSIQSNYIYIQDFVSSLQLSTRPILDLQSVTPNTHVSSTVPIGIGLVQTLVYTWLALPTS